MKNIRIYLLLFTVLIFGAANLQAQKPESDFTLLVTKNIESSLTNDVAGVVEASIFNAVFLKKYYPEANLGQVITELNELSLNGKTASIRYKAHIAAMYLVYGGDYNIELNLRDFKNNPESLFVKLSDELENRFLASTRN